MARGPSVLGDHYSRCWEGGQEPSDEAKPRGLMDQLSMNGYNGVLLNVLWM